MFRKHFSYALILRHKDKSKQKYYSTLTAQKVAAAARGEPTEWQCLLMKRAYEGKEWDTFGGTADPGESAEQTLCRELEEESGLTVKDLYFIGSIRRPFRGGLLIGSGFVVVPKESEWDIDAPNLKTQKEEVDIVAYFDLTDVTDDEPFLRVLGARMKAFLKGDMAADLWQYISPTGAERCRQAGDDCPPPT